MERGELEKIREILKRGGVVIFPTETVYGLGVDPFIKKGIKKLYHIKKRDRKKPLTLHISRISQIYEFSYVNKKATLVIERFLPGPLTLILPKKRGVPRWVVAGKKKVGFRIPNCEVAREIIEFYGSPIAATSVNISGEPPLTTLDEIEKKFGGIVDYIVKDSCRLSKKASTVLDLSTEPFRILREGEISLKDIEEILR